jgi:hypothetical protein
LSSGSCSFQCRFGGVCDAFFDCFVEAGEAILALCEFLLQGCEALRMIFAARGLPGKEAAKDGADPLWRESHVAQV